MSNSTKPRVIRKNIPKQVLTRSAYRRAWPYLALDFDERCAYSMQHTYRAGGRKCMEVDHFNPHKKDDDIQQYKNLFPATRHCNGAKRDRWPSNKDRQQGVRFLNCCEESDYGVHIFEDPDTNELVGVTPEGKYHVRNCDLNAMHLVQERAERAELWQLIESKVIRLKKNVSTKEVEVLNAIRALRTVAETMIPKIKFLSGEALEKYRARKTALAALQKAGNG
jgi:hypothetical protein